MLISKAHLAVRHAASVDYTRHGLQGVRFRGVTHAGDTHELTTEATDGFMILRMTAPISPDDEYPAVAGFTPSPQDPDPFTLPAAAAADLAARLKGAKRATMPILRMAALDVPEANANGHVRIVLTDLETVQSVDARKLEGEWPNVENVIPAKATRAVMRKSEDGTPEPTGEREDVPPTFCVDLRLLERLLKSAREAGMENARTHAVAAAFWIDTKDADKRPLRIEIKHPDVGELLAVVMPMRL